MQEVIRHWRRSICEPITFVIVTLAATLCVISGPFGTLQSFSPAQRFGYWVPVIVLGGCASLFIRIVLRVYFPSVAKVLIETSTVVVFTATFGVVLLVWSNVFANATSGQSYLPSGGMQLLYLALVSGSFLWLRNFVIEVVRRKATAVKVEVTDLRDEKPSEQTVHPRLLRRLQDEDRSRVLYLAAEDHFVTIHTEDCVHRLRMRFKDAIDEMEGVEGYYTHRSYWVTRAAVSNAFKSGSAWRLRLTTGDDIPVSRKFQPDLEAAGLLRLDAAE